MTEEKRILLNVIATYGRSLYGLVIGLLCGRWTLMTLGEIDYGLYGLVGGLTVFISFINSVLAGANSRFYAFSIGAAKISEDREMAVEDCRKWFNTALSVHSVIPIILVIIGYPIGVYAIEHWLVIPADRIDACIWVFRFACISCFVSMVNVPFSAMYGAKQYIAELTIYSFLTVTFNVIVLHYMVTHPKAWLTEYAAWSCFLVVVPQAIICLRAIKIFPECRINISYMWDRERIRKLGSFAGWQFLGVACDMLRVNGLSIVVNKFFGAKMNAAQSIGNTVQAQCNTLASAMQNALVPVITQACGAHDYNNMNKFVIRVGKFNVIFSLIFMIPLALELPLVMRYWLKNVPAFTVGLSYIAMLVYVVNASTAGHVIAINAFGKIALFHVVLCALNILTLPSVIVCGFLTRNIYLMMFVTVAFVALLGAGRVFFAKILVSTSIRAWVGQVLIPAILLSAVSAIIGRIVNVTMAESFLRICITTLMVECVFLPLAWRFFLLEEEREYVLSKFYAAIKAIGVH